MPRTLSAGGVLALVQVLAACGGSSPSATGDAGGLGDGGGVDAGAGDVLVPGEFSASMADLDCGSIRRCWPPDGWADLARKNACDAHSRVGWQDFAEQVLAPLVAAGELTYDAEALAQCAAAFAATCYPGLPEACGHIVAGRRRSGEPCTLLRRLGWDNWWSSGWVQIMAAFPPSSCGPGLLCDPAGADGACGQCRPLPGAGEFCGPDDACAAGTYCASTRCQPFSGEGEPCEDHVIPSGCGPGLGCLPTTARCVRMPGLGETCSEEPSTFVQCDNEPAPGQPPLECAAGICVYAGAAAGQPCSGAGWCRLGLTCGAAGVCVPFAYVGEGEPCDWPLAQSCASNDLACVPDAGGQGVCRRIVLVDIGEPCGGERRCTGLGTCDTDGLCHFAQAEGDTCYHLPTECDVDCAQPGGCLLAVHLACAEGLYCPADLLLSPGCSDLGCVRYGANPTCSSDAECGPDMRCAPPAPSCVPLDAQPGFVGPVTACE